MHELKRILQRVFQHVYIFHTVFGPTKGVLHVARISFIQRRHKQRAEKTQHNTTKPSNWSGAFKINAVSILFSIERIIQYTAKTRQHVAFNKNRLFS